MAIRTYYDPLHKGISLDSNKPEELMVMELIDSIPFQRLRRIKQLGPASLTFHGAESSRFTHSLGVFEISRKALNSLVRICPELNNYRHILYGSALLHDIGHGPLSHTSELIFEMSHEKWTSRLIKGHKSIRESLEGFSVGSSDQIADLISGKNILNNAIKSLISSQLDCDRIDYLLRDSYSTGTSYGLLDLERIIAAMTIAPDGELAINPKGLLAVEHYLVTRNLMYRSVYNHRLNEVSNWLLEKIFQTVKILGPNKIRVEPTMAKWLWNKNDINIEEFLENDDNFLYFHLSRWAKNKNKILSNLCNRFLNRNLFKAIDIEGLNNKDQLKALSIARNLTTSNSMDADFSCGIRKQKLHGYHPYKGGLRLWDGNKLEAIENVSSLIKSLIKPAKSTWLIYDKSIELELKKELLLLEESQS
tara:strand:- start:4625 stop:5884 length:1260 start_codon:yes stop_codon:yes gene_type:complete